MCGICGFYSKNRITADQLTLMNDTMYHRGPDDAGAEIFPAKEGYCVGLAQRRLSILDLSPLGHQPMHSKDGRLSIVFNGEIYNFAELKKELSDYPFCSNCDTEVILAAYLKWGISCVHKLCGMFAIALYDRQEETLYLVRDRIGKKPLYYWEEEGNLVFASELKPIMSCPGFQRKLRTDVIARYLYHQYLCEPDSVFENVYKVRPGEIISFRLGKIHKQKYWDVKEVYQKKKGTFTGNYEEARQELFTLLKAAVQKRLVADVPVGTFLSGGFDSSLVTALAASVSGEPVKTFSIGFTEKRYNEAEYAGKYGASTDKSYVFIWNIFRKKYIIVLDNSSSYDFSPWASHVAHNLQHFLAAVFFCVYNIIHILGKAWLYQRAVCIYQIRQTACHIREVFLCGFDKLFYSIGLYIVVTIQKN